MFQSQVKYKIVPVFCIAKKTFLFLQLDSTLKLSISLSVTHPALVLLVCSLSTANRPTFHKIESLGLCKWTFLACTAVSLHHELWIFWLAFHNLLSIKSFSSVRIYAIHHDLRKLQRTSCASMEEGTSDL